MQTVPASDRGLTLGVGLFETILAVEGRLVLWDAHLDRLARGCAALSLSSPDRAACAGAARAALEAAGLVTGRAAVRLTWTGGDGARGLAPPSPARPRLLATASPAAPPLASVALHTSAIRRNASSPLSRLKTLSYLDNVLARAEAIAAGAEEALLCDHAGSVACAAAANIFWIAHGELHTPALDCGVLDGVVRDVALHIALRHGFTVREVHAPISSLLACDGGFLTNSLQTAVAIRSLDGTGLSAPGPALLDLMADLRSTVS